MIRRATPDIRFARKVIDTIASLPDQRRHPGLTWDQEFFRMVDVATIVRADTGAPLCPIAMCVAGWVVELDPDVGWAYDAMTLRTAGLTDDTTMPPVRLDADLTTARDLATGKQLRAAEYAARRLGLSEPQAHEMFHSANTLDELTEIIDRIERGRL